MSKFIVLIVFLVLLALVGRRRQRRQLPHNRVRHMRIRLHMHRRPGHGFATGFGLWWHFSARASLRVAGQTRPSLTRRYCRQNPDEHSVYLGRAHHWHALRISVEQHVLIFAPPRTGKTQLLGRIIAHHPGPVLSTSTRPDVYRATRAARQLVGPVAVFSPQGVGGVCSTFAFDPIEGCEDASVAIRRADGFANAVRGSDSEDNALFNNCARAYLRALFHAAALAGGDMRLVSRWARTAVAGGARPAEAILRANGKPDWADELAQVRGKADRTAATNEMVLTQTLGFMTDPEVAVAALPGLVGGLDLPAFLAASGTLYLIADPAGNDESPLNPLFAALANEVHHIAGQIGLASPGERLDPPLCLALDEATQICRVPLDRWLADSGGKGIQVFTVVHGESQLQAAWGAPGRKAIMTTSGCKIALPGITDTDTLDDLSTLCGDASFRERGDDKHSRSPVMTPAMINQLPDGYALVKWANRPAVIAKLAASRKDRAIRRANRAGFSQLRPGAIAGEILQGALEEELEYVSREAFVEALASYPAEDGSTRRYAWQAAGAEDSPGGDA